MRRIPTTKFSQHNNTRVNHQTGRIDVKKCMDKNTMEDVKKKLLKNN
jgi:hypothetical protein